jgi:hypothetical protein
VARGGEGWSGQREAAAQELLSPYFFLPKLFPIFCFKNFDSNQTFIKLESEILVSEGSF